MQPENEVNDRHLPDPDARVLDHLESGHAHGKIIVTIAPLT
jgi:hypothetical protein